jgi:hypothetical protein
VSGSRILATTDDGVHWRTQHRASHAGYGAIDAIDSRHAWVIGRAAILRTRDGGRHWTAMAQPCPAINSLHFVDPNHGYAVAGNQLVRTRDGGRHWHQVAAPSQAQSVCFTDRARGWLGAHGQIYRTRNGGTSWIRSVRGVVEKRRPPGDDYRALVQCAGPNDGWAELIGGAAASQQSHIGYHLADSGSQPVFAEGYFPHPPLKNLPQSPSSYSGAFSAIDATSAYYLDSCTACGYGTVTIDLASQGGAQLRKVGMVHHLDNVDGASFTSSVEGWAIGWVLHPKHRRMVYRIVHTTDGGASWRVQYSH